MKDILLPILTVLYLGLVWAGYMKNYDCYLARNRCTSSITRTNTKIGSRLSNFMTKTALSRARRRIFIGIRKKMLALADAAFPESLTQI